jgi:hypothetical protein
LAFVTRAAEIFDEVYEFQVNDLGYPPPPLDFGVDGPEYDVYMYNYGDYGATTAERPVPETGWDDYTSWIEIDNDFQHTYTNGEDALKVTAAHEFFHMIQIGYRSYHLTSKLNSIFLYEACAAWMEDVVYDEINDYYQYLENFYSNPDEPFHLFDGEHEYGLSVFFHMLEQKYDLDIVKAIWSEFKDHDVLTAIENAVQSYQTTFSKELADFTVWNCFTGKNAEHFSYYEEAKNYPEIKANEELDLFEKVSIRDSCKELVAKYYKLQPQAFGNYVFKPAFEEPHNWLSSVIINSVPGVPYVATCGGNKDQSLNNLEASSSVWLAIMNSKKPQKDISYEFQTLDIRIERGTLANARSEITAAVPSPFIIGEHPAVEFQYTLKESYQNATVYILSENGVTVKQEYLNWMPSGMGKWVWDGRNDNGEYVSSGIYLFQIITDQVTGPFKFALIR